MIDVFLIDLDSGAEILSSVIFFVTLPYFKEIFRINSMSLPLVFFMYFAIIGV